MPKRQRLFGIHRYRPVDNFQWVIGRNFRGAILPFDDGMSMSGNPEADDV
jgi:hypothetical protein